MRKKNSQKGQLKSQRKKSSAFKKKKSNMFKKIPHKKIILNNSNLHNNQDRLMSSKEEKGAPATKIRKIKGLKAIKRDIKTNQRL